MKTLRCGVIGLGRLGYRHASNLVSRVANAELIAVCDGSLEALQRFSHAFPQVPTYLQYEELLAIKELDAVIIASSTTMHARMIEAALLAKKAVFCEKPLSMDVEEAKEIKTLVDASGMFLQLGFMRRFDTGYLRAKQKIDSGELGQPVSILGISRDPSCPPLSFASTSGGLIMDLCVHDFDLCRYFLQSEATEVYARGGVVRYEQLKGVSDIDHVNIDIRFENGKLASLEGSRNSQYGYDVRTEVICSEGASFIGRICESDVTFFGGKGMNCETVPGFLERFSQAYLHELECFVSDVLENRKPSVGVDDGLAALILAVASNESLQTNKPVRVSR